MKKSLGMLVLASGLIHGVAAAAPHTYEVGVAGETPVTVVLEDTEGASVEVDSAAKVGLTPAPPAAQVRLYVDGGRVWVRTAQRWLNNPEYIGLMGYYTLPEVEAMESRMPLELPRSARVESRFDSQRPQIVISRLD